MEIVSIHVYLSNLLIAEGRAKGWLLVSRPWLNLNSHVHDGRNTQYLNTRIVLDDLQPWDDTFPTYDDIFQFSQSTPHLRQRFHEEEIGDPTFSFQTRFITAPMVFDEQDLAAARNEFYVHLNYLLRLATDTGIEGQNFIMVGGGKAAKLRRLGGDAKSKIPDRASFWTCGVYPRYSSSERHDTNVPADHIPCLMVGDYKLAGKFYHQMLTERTRRTDEELQFVMNQIHDYMDMNHCRFGYILTETELIMFRRRCGPEKWGLMDYSQPIPLNAPADNEVNAMMVLWYFHVKYAWMNLEPGYELRSAYSCCPRELGGGIYSNDERRRLRLPPGPKGETGKGRGKKKGTGHAAVKYP